MVVGYGRAVAAATARGFKFHQPDNLLCETATRLGSSHISSQCERSRFHDHRGHRIYRGVFSRSDSNALAAIRPDGAGATMESCEGARYHRARRERTCLFYCCARFASDFVRVRVARKDWKLVSANRWRSAPVFRFILFVSAIDRQSSRTQSRHRRERAGPRGASSSGR